jgi:hypothetical protein
MEFVGLEGEIDEVSSPVGILDFFLSIIFIKLSKKYRGGHGIRSE